MFPKLVSFLPLMLLMNITNTSAQSHQDVFLGLSGQELLDSLIVNYKPVSILNYDKARDTMFSIIYKEGDSVSCVYSRHTLYLDPTQDPSTYLYAGGSADGMHAEHTFPQSKGASSGNAKSDMHHIYPARGSVNSARNNTPFAELEDSLTNTWYYLNYRIDDSIPAVNIDAYSERLTSISFEPREDHKGNVARAMFYFYTMYQAEADAADPSFFENQRQTLCHWHQQDPIDQKEWDRTFLIASYQNDKPNPFVLDCSLVERTYGAGVIQGCVPDPVKKLPSNEDINVAVYPNPSKNFCHVQLFDKTTIDSWLLQDALGRILLWGEQELQDFIINTAQLPQGLYYLTLFSKKQRSTKKIIVGH